ncbi:hypothetical protein Tco_1390876 [Tanacetum coccineum]
MTVNGGEPPVNHRWPPPNHRSSADGPPPDHWSTVVDRRSMVEVKEYLESDDEIEDDKVYKNKEIDIANMTMEKYELYELARSKKRSGYVEIANMTMEEYDLYIEE